MEIDCDGFTTQNIFIDIGRVAEAIFSFPDKQSEKSRYNQHRFLRRFPERTTMLWNLLCKRKAFYRSTSIEKRVFTSVRFVLALRFHVTERGKKKMKGNSTLWRHWRKTEWKSKKNFTPCLSVKYSYSQPNIQPWESKRLNRLENIHFIRKVDTNWITRLSRQSRCNCVGGHPIPMLSIPKTFS